MSRATVLVVDSGGRGDALVYKYSQSLKVGKVLAIPGNDLMQFNSKKVKTIPRVGVTDILGILKICKKYKVDLIDVGPEEAIEAGVVDHLEKVGFAVVGPTRISSQIEWDKAWARGFMRKYKLPIPKFFVFHNQKEGVKFLKNTKNRAWFVKANGLLGGKGALPARDSKEAKQRISELEKFGRAGETYLLEEWLVGEEFSAFAICDGKDFKIVGSAQDYKRMFNFDEGENTGGMGSSSPVSVVNAKIRPQISKIFKTTFDGLAREGRQYKGVLYLGGIIVKGKVFVIEFNARWGDPEAEVLIPSIRTDFYDVGRAIALGGVAKLKVKQDKLVRVAVCGASRPGVNTRGLRVFGLERARNAPGVKIFGKRVNKKGGKYYADQGRLFFVMGEGKSVSEARESAYQAMAMISIEGNNLHYRTDIGYRDVERVRG